MAPLRIETTETLLAALDQIGEIVLVTDTNGCITYANYGFERLTGYSASEAIGKKPNILSSGHTPTEVYSTMWSTVLSGEVWEGLLVNRRKDGSLFDCRLVVAPVVYNGEIVRLVSVQEDLTEQMESRRALERQAELLEQEIADRTRDLEQHARALVHAEKLATIGELSASIAHEVLNPVMGISGALQILQRRISEDDPNRKIIERVRLEVQRLDETVRGLLSMVRPKTAERRARVNIVDVINSATGLVRSKALESGIRIHTKCDDGPYLVWVNDVQIRQIFLNLLVNAVAALEGNSGQINISCSINNHMISIEIEDDGPGVPDDFLPKLFEPFVTTREDGTGLGLPISRRIARRHGGDLAACESREQGACFVLTLPQAMD